MKATGHSLSNLRNIPCIYQKKNGRSYVCFEFDTYEVNIMHITYLLMYNMYHIHIMYYLSQVQTVNRILLYWGVWV